MLSRRSTTFTVCAVAGLAVSLALSSCAPGTGTTPPAASSPTATASPTVSATPARTTTAAAENPAPAAATDAPAKAPANTPASGPKVFTFRDGHISFTYAAGWSLATLPQSLSTR
ncbi:MULTISPECIES: hypothetical protein [Arthrobacter]|uniref:Uncharacterized protein n=1 Tax=Arthrobacter terricola TaxID=2547396 RepID=A0A4R5KZZ9_9MICC|nr:MULTISPECIES: hypothetical protein [Arthrobacter]MBT8159623.1 hypothetical protein [Arthrobacter sp. GN70]TDG01263.1 hypothetical protein E1809_01700 [Arthrobacter terricola]